MEIKANLSQSLVEVEAELGNKVTITPSLCFDIKILQII